MLLRDLPQRGQLVKDRAYRQVWRFEWNGKPYYLKFYPEGGWREWFRRKLRGSPALREFHRLQWLQKARIPSPRAVATLIGFHLGNARGDAVISEGLEPSIQLDRYLNQCEIDGRDPENRHELGRQLIDLLRKLGQAGLGHDDLHLGNILLKDGQLYLLDGYAVHRKGLLMGDVELLAMSARPYATRTDLLRAWRSLGPKRTDVPRRNGLAGRIWRRLLTRAFKNDRYFGHLAIGPWRGHFFRHAKFPHRWSPLSRSDIRQTDWEEAWPRLLEQIDGGQFEVLKHSRSGDVLAGQIVLGGRPIDIVVKRPRRRHWYRYINEIGRGTRPPRMEASLAAHRPQHPDGLAAADDGAPAVRLRD